MDENVLSRSIKILEDNLMKAQSFKPSAFTINMGLLCIALTIACMLLNRAFVIGCLTGIIFLLFSFQKVKANKKVLVAFGALLILIIGILALYVKSDSSLGRILIYKISWSMFLEHPFTGIGWGKFQREYGLHQALFFQSGNYTQKEFLLAGNTFYAFNDYWEFIIETGMSGAICLFLCLYLVIRLAISHLKKEPSDHFLKLLIAIGLGIGSAALFTHVLEHQLFKLLVLVILVYVIIPGRTSLHFKRIALAIFILVALFSMCLFEVRSFTNYHKWKQAKNLSTIGYILESQKIYAALSPSLKWDIGFLKDYNDALSGDGNLVQKLFLLKEILGQYTDNISYLNLANVYDEMGMKREAERAHLLAVNIVPNRFVPKEALYQFYLRNKQFEQAGNLRTTILSMPVKVPSERVELIKQNIKKSNINLLKKQL